MGTAKGEEDKVLALQAQQKLSEEHMSTATRHFSQKTKQETETSKRTAGTSASSVMDDTPAMPMAIQHFTVKDRTAKEKAAMAIRELNENPHIMQAGQAYFTWEMVADKGKKAAEIKELKANPPAPSMAGRHFAKANEAKQAEIATSVDQPASVASSHFNKKAEVEQERRELENEKLAQDEEAAYKAAYDEAYRNHFRTHS